MKIIFVLVCLLIANEFCDARVWEFCALARQLNKFGFSKSELPNWMCLIQHESNYNSKAVGPPNSDGSRDYGLFQINNRYWCENGKKGKGCNIDCNSK
jgi:hypothetical protein